MKRNACIVFLAMVILLPFLKTFAQTNPLPYDLSIGPYAFTSWSAAAVAGTYPQNMIFHQFGQEPVAATEPSGDYSCPYNLTSRCRLTGIDTAGFAFFNTASIQNAASCTASGGFVGAAVLAINTAGQKNIRVGYTAGTLAQGDGTIPREYRIKIQYRFSVTDAWADLSLFSEYSSSGKAAGSFQQFSAMLSAAFEDQPLVQLRWKYYNVPITGASGTRPQLRLDNITVSGVSSVPAIRCVPNSLAFVTAPQVTSVKKYFIQGANLTDSVLLVPVSPFSIGLAADGPYREDTLRITPGAVNAGIYVYVSYRPLTTGSHTGAIHYVSGNLSGDILLSGTTVDLIPIPKIQGAGRSSTYAGDTIMTEGVVTAVLNGKDQFGGFYIQDLSGDGDALTSDGIFVQCDSLVLPGDLVRVVATVTESYGMTVLNVESLQVTGSSYRVDPVKIELPADSIPERYEGMLVRFDQDLTVVDSYNLSSYGELTLSGSGRLFVPSTILDPDDDPATGTRSDGASNMAALNALEIVNNRSKIVLDDNSNVQYPSVVPYLDSLTQTLRLGSLVSRLTGVLEYRYGTYRIQPVQPPVITYAARPVPTALNNSGLKIASFNVLNFFNGDGAGGGFPTERGANTPAEFNRQRDKIVAALEMLNADIVGLIEIENDGSGPASAIASLVSALNSSIGTPTYSYIQDPAGANGNPGNDAIKVALIYKPSAVTPYGEPRASSDVAFMTARNPLAQTFQVRGSKELFTVIVNHFKSKNCGSGADAATGNDMDLSNGIGCWNETRKSQAAALLYFITQLQQETEDDDVLVLGDFNSNDEEDAMDILRAGGLINLIENTYSFVYNGEAGDIDHILATPPLSSRIISGFTCNINADEPRVLDYNEESGQGALNLYNAGPYRSSDHDPVLVELNLGQGVANGIIPLSDERSVLKIYPNPVTGAEAHFSEKVAGTVFDLTGSTFVQLDDVTSVNVLSWPEGMYLVRTKDGRCGRMEIIHR